MSDGFFVVGGGKHRGKKLDVGSPERQSELLEIQQPEEYKKIEEQFEQNELQLKEDADKNLKKVVKNLTQRLRDCTLHKHQLQMEVQTYKQRMQDSNDTFQFEVNLLNKENQNLNNTLRECKKDIEYQDTELIKFQEKLEQYEKFDEAREIYKIVDTSLKGSKDETLALMSFFIDSYGLNTEHFQKAKSSALRNSFCQNQVGSASSDDLLFSSLKLQNQALLTNLSSTKPALYKQSLQIYEKLQRISQSQNFCLECVVCQETLSEKDQSQKLAQCKHDQFHKTCIKKWLQVQNVCPICRHVV